MNELLKKIDELPDDGKFIMGPDGFPLTPMNMVCETDDLKNLTAELAAVRSQLATAKAEAVSEFIRLLTPLIRKRNNGQFVMTVTFLQDVAEVVSAMDIDLLAIDAAGGDDAK